MGSALAFSAWLVVEALQGGPSIAGRVFDAQTGGFICKWEGPDLDA